MKKIIFSVMILLFVWGSLGWDKFPEYVKAANLTYPVSFSDNSDVSLNQKIADKQREIKELKSFAGEYRQKIKDNKNKILNLGQQIKELDNKIAKKELDIKRLNLQSEKVFLEIEQAQKKISGKELEISKYKNNLAEVVRQINKNDKKTYLTVMLLNSRFSDFFNQAAVLKKIEVRISTLLEELKRSKLQLFSAKETVDGKYKELELYKINRRREQMFLESEKESKKILIDQTGRSEVRFRQLIARLAREQEKIDREIGRIEKQIEFKQIYKEANYTWDPDKIRLQLPVPYNGITVFFHDPSYPFRRLVGEHSGIDMRTLIDGHPAPGIPVHSAAPGVVMKIIRNGRFVGNAVYIAHSNNFMTAYYHLSQVNVAEDDVVIAGTLLGLSGGMPGESGAGLSNGPHLHFEVRLDGIPVDPLQYLDIK